MQKVKRSILQTGLILSVIMFSIVFLDTLVSSSVASELEIYSAVVILYFLMMLSIVGIVFASIGLAACGKPYEVYKSKSGFILTNFILICIMALLAIIGLFNINTITMFMLIELTLLVLSAVFTMIGYVKAKQTNNLDFNSSKPSTFEDAYQKIEKLRKLRELNIITEDEYESLKRTQIDQLNQ